MILVTRPERASLSTKARLEALGHEVLVDPLLTLEFFPPERLIETAPDALVITSSNGARAIAGHAELARLLSVPVFTVGGRTSDAVRELGFQVAGEAPDVAHLVELLRKEPVQNILYLAAQNRAGELSELLPGRKVETRVVYSAVAARALAAATVEALGSHRITHVLHYSRRLTETYLGLAAEAGISPDARACAHLCLSEQVAAPLREAGAKEIKVAGEPKEDALIGLLPIPLSSPSGEPGVR
jgi:uroporphyrinogen-III synthase